MHRPEALSGSGLFKWSIGDSSDIWNLLVASADGDLARVQQLVAQDPTLVHAQYAYRTPIYFAVRENRLDVARFLLQHGADPLGLVVGDPFVQVCRDRGYPEMERVLQDHLRDVLNASDDGELVAEIIRAHDQPRMQQLLDARPELLHKGDLRSNQPIHWAVMTRQIDFIDALLARGADIHARRYDHATPLQLVNGDYHFRGWRDVPKDWPVKPLDVIAHLRSRGADCDICTACHIGDIDRVRELLAQDPSLANKLTPYASYYAGSGSPLKNAAARGHMEIVQLLLAHGADPNLPEPDVAPDGHALYAAVTHRHIDIVRLLLQHGAHPNPEVESSADALSIAIDNKDEPMVELLCRYGASRCVDLLACYNDLRTAAAVFAANPALANDPLALADAAANGHDSFVRLMLRYQPGLSKRIAFPDWAVGAPTRELNELLFQDGLSPSHRNWLGVTPLHLLAAKGDLDKATIFLDHGADVEAVDDDLQTTPLGWAAKSGQLEMVRLLLNRGASKTPKDVPAWSMPQAWATRRGHTEIAVLLSQP